MTNENGMESKFDVKKIKAIIGLGNPGVKYYKNRHSIGFRVVDQLAAVNNASWRCVDQMEHTTIHLDTIDHDLILVKPQTFMNNSGRVLSWLLKKGIKPDQMLVIHDELEKPFGQCLIRFGGSHKGHNGLKSIMSIIGPDFWRLKFGIGRPSDRNEVPNYVLTDFGQPEEEQVNVLIDKAIALLGEV